MMGHIFLASTVKVSILLDDVDNLTNEECNVFTVMAILHDSGNLISREHHSAVSVQLFDEIFSNYDPEDSRVVSIHLGMLLHDHIGIYAQDIGSLPPIILQRSIWALIAADKMDIGEHRLSTTLLQDPLPASIENLVEMYPHMLFSLYAKDSFFALSQGKKTGLFQVNFSSDARRSIDPLASDILKKFRWVRQKSGRRSTDLRAPEQWFYLSRYESVPYAFKYHGEIEAVYAERFAQMFACLFALYPTLEQINFDTVDPNPRKVKTGRTTFTRQSWPFPLYDAWKQREKAKGTITDGVQEKDVPPNLLKGWEMDQERIAEEWRQTPGKTNGVV